LSGWRPVDLAAQVLGALLDCTSADPAMVDDVIMGCVSKLDEQSMNVARNAAGIAQREPER
jgi:acetyl-CoA C-acetyltransferase